MTARVWHEELSGMVEGPALFEGQQEWVRAEDYLQQSKDLERYQAMFEDAVNQHNQQMARAESSEEVSAFNFQILQIVADYLIREDILAVSRDGPTPDDAAANIVDSIANVLDRARRAEDALQAVIVRSWNDPLGTSKVIDMRKIAQEALEPKGEQQ